MWWILGKCLHSGLKFRRQSWVMLQIAIEVVDGRLIFNETRNHWNHRLRRRTSRMVTSGGTVASLVTILYIWNMYDKLLIMKNVYFLISSALKGEGVDDFVRIQNLQLKAMANTIGFLTGKIIQILHSSGSISWSFVCWWWWWCWCCCCCCW